MIPDYQRMMFPVLNLLSDGQEHTMSELIDAAAVHFKLSEAERRELLPSGTQLTLGSRVGWAKTFLSKSGLLSSPRRGVVRITQRGRESLSKAGEGVNTRYLESFSRIPSVQEGKSANRSLKRGITFVG